jgi:hypothetical protein
MTFYKITIGVFFEIIGDRSKLCVKEESISTGKTENADGAEAGSSKSG